MKEFPKALPAKPPNPAAGGADGHVSGAVYKVSVAGVADETAGAGTAAAVPLSPVTVPSSTVQLATRVPRLKVAPGQSASCAAISAALDVNAFQVEIHDGVRDGVCGIRIGNVAEKAGVVGQAVFCGLDGFIHIQTGDGVALPVKVTKESVD